MFRSLTLLLFLFAPAAVARTPVFDVHVHLRDGEESLRNYQASVADANLDLAGVGAMWFGGTHQALQGETAKIIAGNDAVIALAAKYPEVVPIATVHPYDGDVAMNELSRVAAAGVNVLKIHAHTQRFDVADPRVLALVTRAGELGIVVLMDNAGILPDDNEKLFNLSLQATKTKFIFAHMGATEFRFWSMLSLARTADDFFADNIYFDISAVVLLASDSPLEQEFVWTIRKVGVERVLLGSDYPQMALGKTVEAFERLGLSEEEKDRIRFGNARRLLGRQCREAKAQCQETP